MKNRYDFGGDEHKLAALLKKFERNYRVWRFDNTFRTGEESSRETYLIQTVLILQNSRIPNALNSRP